MIFEKKNLTDKKFFFNSKHLLNLLTIRKAKSQKVILMK